VERSFDRSRSAALEKSLVAFAHTAQSTRGGSVALDNLPDLDESASGPARKLLAFLIGPSSQVEVRPQDVSRNSLLRPLRPASPPAKRFWLDDRGAETTLPM